MPRAAIYDENVNPNPPHSTQQANVVERPARRGLGGLNPEPADDQTVPQDAPSFTRTVLQSANAGLGASSPSAFLNPPEVEVPMPAPRTPTGPPASPNFNSHRPILSPECRPDLSYLGLTPYFQSLRNPSPVEEKRLPFPLSFDFNAALEEQLRGEPMKTSKRLRDDEDYSSLFDGPVMPTSLLELHMFKRPRMMAPRVGEASTSAAPATEAVVTTSVAQSSQAIVSSPSAVLKAEEGTEAAKAVGDEGKGEEKRDDVSKDEEETEDEDSETGDQNEDVQDGPDADYEEVTDAEDDEEEEEDDDDEEEEEEDGEEIDSQEAPAEADDD